MHQGYRPTVKFTVLFDNSRNCCTILLTEYTHATWFTKPNYDLAPVLSGGVGKFLLAFMISLDGIMSDGIMVRVPLQNLNVIFFSTCRQIVTCCRMIVQWICYLAVYHQGKVISSYYFTWNVIGIWQAKGFHRRFQLLEVCWATSFSIFLLGNYHATAPF